MSYLTQSRISTNGAMLARVAQAVTEEPQDVNGDQWASDHAREWAAAPGWDDAWEYAVNTHPPEEFPGYDPGADEAVITDGMILSKVQAMLTSPGGVLAEGDE